MSDATNAALICTVCNSFSTKSCSKCSKAGIKVTYCGSECQLKDWRSGHKKRCGRLPSDSGPVPRFERRGDVAVSDSSKKQQNILTFKKLTLAESDGPEMNAMDSKEQFRVTSLPQINDGYGTVECIIPHRIKVKILSAPGFPKPPMSVSTRFDLRDMHTGEKPKIDQSNLVMPQLGMFAIEDIEAGTCIKDERPMIISTHVLPMAVLVQPGIDPQQVPEIMKNDMNDFIKHAWNRMEPEDQITYLSLANAHTDGDDKFRPFLGRVGTNALACDFNDPGCQYGGVCKVLSRVNHSCTPNSTWTFDLLSLSFQLWAVRKIPAGEQVTLTYAAAHDDYEDRRDWLLRYGFECVCPACLDHNESDMRRRAIFQTKMSTMDQIKMWIRSKTSPDDFLISPAMKHLELIETEGIEAIDQYCDRLAEVFLCSIALGWKTEAVRYRGLLMQHKGRIERGESCDRSLAFQVLKGTMHEDDVTKHPSWNARARRC